MGIEDHEQLLSIQAHPNPANQFIQISGNGIASKDLEINVVDISGKVVLAEKANVAGGFLNKTINVYSLQPGVYFINVKDGSHYHAIKFIKI